MAQIERALALARGRTVGPERMVLLTIVGVKFRTPSGHVVIPPDVEPFVVYAAGPNDGVPTEKQKAEALRLWSTVPDCPNAFLFPERGKPTLPVPQPQPSPQEIHADV
jgi:hypothetical protein